MVANSSTCMLVGLVANVLAQLITHNFKESCLGAREESLPDTTALIEELVVGNILLVFVPVAFIL